MYSTEKVLKDFRDVPLKEREKAIGSELVEREMLSKLPPLMRNMFVDAFLNPAREEQIKTDERTIMLKIFFAQLNISAVANHIITHKPSSHKALEALYNKSPVMFVDRYFYDCRAGDAIPDRLNAVVENVPHLIRKIGEEKAFIKVLIPGSGSAQDIIRILVNNPDIRHKTVVRCIDDELSAIKLGRKMAKKAGVSDNVVYVKDDLMRLDYQDTDLVLLVGIICPLPNIVSIKVVKKVVSYCRKGALVVFSAALQKMLIEDPVTCFIMDIAGWRLNYKTKKEVEEIAKKSGLAPRGSFQDPKNKYHQIIIGEVI